MGHRVFELAGRIYALGGQHANAQLIPMDHFSVFNPLASEEHRYSRQEIHGTKISKRAFFSIGLIGEKLYVYGGQDENGHRLSDVYVIDLKSLYCKELRRTTVDDGRWPSPRSHCLDWVWEKKLFVLGGTTPRYGDSR